MGRSAHPEDRRHATAGWPRGLTRAKRSGSVRSVAEVAHAGEHHGDAVLVGSGKHFFVTHGATRLDDGLNTCFSDFFHVIRKWEEGI